MMRVPVIEGMGYYQQDYRAWMGHYWECTECETYPLDGPFEDSGLCESCAQSHYQS